MVRWIRFLGMGAVVLSLFLPAVSPAAPLPLPCQCEAANFGLALDASGGEYLRCSLVCSAEGKDGGQKVGPFKTTVDQRYEATDVARIVGKVINSLLVFLGVLFLLFTIYAGGVWLFARGEQEKAQNARDILQAAILGIILIVASYVLMNFIFLKILEAVLNKS